MFKKLFWNFLEYFNNNHVIIRWMMGKHVCQNWRDYEGYSKNICVTMMIVLLSETVRRPEAQLLRVLIGRCVFCLVNVRQCFETGGVTRWQ